MSRDFIPAVLLFVVLFLIIGIIVVLFSRPADPQYSCTQSGGVWIPGARGEGVCAR